MNKKIIYFSVFIIVCALAVFLVLSLNKKEVPVVLSFEDCSKAGYPVMESYPRQCRTPDGRIFAEEITPPITYTNATPNLIQVELPFPGAVTGKTFKVIGKARGTWFFEASFPIELLDNNGKVIAVGIAQAKDEWMTENFVPFEAEIKAPVSYIGEATLLLKKDNPSGLPEYDASISFPITVEY
jgi:hypothetical protein